MQSLFELFHERAERTALVDMRSGAIISFAKLANLLLRGRAFLQAHGVEPGDSLVCRLPNSPEALSLFLICLESGVRCAPLSARATCEEAETWVRMTGAKLAVISRTQADATSEALAARTRTVRIDTSGAFDWLPDVAKALTPPHEGALLVRTSGSSGEPKLAAIPARSLRGCARAFGGDQPAIGPDERWLNVAPLWTLYGLFNLGLLPLELGSSVVIGGEFSTQVPSKFWHDISRFEVSLIWLVPTMIRVLLSAHSRALASGREAAMAGAGRVRCGFVGMAPCTASEKAEFTQAFGIPLYENYGLTETLFLTTASPNRPDDVGAGRPLRGVEIRLGETSVPPVLPPNDPSAAGIGEILARTPYLFSGYLQQGGAIQPPKLDDEGFLHTGDLGRITWHGCLAVDGRLKAMVKRAGHPVFLTEIEALARTVTDVAEVAAVPTPHQFFVESYVLFVQPTTKRQDGRELIEQVRLILAKRLAREKWPEEIRVVRDFPLLASGKLDYAALMLSSQTAPTA